MVGYAFNHLDPSATKIYQSTVVYGFEDAKLCFTCRVKAGYVAQTPKVLGYRWIRGQHIDTLAQFFVTIMPLRYCST
jgi:hypothetical protein